MESDPDTIIRKLGAKLGTSHKAGLKHLRAMNKVKKLGLNIPHELTELEMVEIHRPKERLRLISIVEAVGADS